MATPAKTRAKKTAIETTTTVTETAEKLTATGRPCAAVEEKPRQSAWSRFRFFIQKYDAFWSLPVFFCLYFGSGLLLVHIFGYSMELYPLEAIQPLFLSCFIVLGAASFSLFMLRFYFNTINKYIWGKRSEKEKVIINYSKDDFRKLNSWQRIKISLSVFFVFVFLVVIIYKMTV